MKIGGLQKFSLLDYPDHLSAIIFIQGCNFRCQFCYNPTLVWPRVVGRVEYSSLKGEEQKGHSLFPDPAEMREEGKRRDDLFDFLNRRIGKLEGVVITGGEPTIHADLPEFIAEIRKIGYLTKLDTNGSNPGMLESLIGNGLLDYLAMDLKGPEGKHEKIAGIKADFEKIRQSIKIIMESGLPYEFRTTVVPGLVGEEEIREMASMIRAAKKWYLQNFKGNVDILNNEYKGRPGFGEKELESILRAARSQVENSYLR